jgi:hypothetical protein
MMRLRRPEFDMLRDSFSIRRPCRQDSRRVELVRRRTLAFLLTGQSRRAAARDTGDVRLLACRTGHPGRPLPKLKAQLWETEPESGRSWLPAYVVRGEGLFFEVERVRHCRAWERSPQVRATDSTCLLSIRSARRAHSELEDPGERPALRPHCTPSPTCSSTSSSSSADTAPRPCENGSSVRSGARPDGRHPHLHRGGRLRRERWVASSAWASLASSSLRSPPRSNEPVADLTGERRIRPLIAERDNFVEQHRRPHVRILGQPLTDVGLEPVERIRRAVGSAAHTGFAFAVQMGSDRLAVPAGVAGDRRDRPPVVLIGDDEGWCSAVRVGLLPPVTRWPGGCCRPCCPGAADL